MVFPLRSFCLGHFPLFFFWGFPAKSVLRRRWKRHHWNPMTFGHKIHLSHAKKHDFSMIFPWSFHHFPWLSVVFPCFTCFWVKNAGPKWSKMIQMRFSKKKWMRSWWWMTMSSNKMGIDLGHTMNSTRTLRDFSHTTSDFQPNSLRTSWT